jgi:hypothetical protein
LKKIIGTIINLVINSLVISNSYWVIPGRFRAGEHPGINTEEARWKLYWLMDIGVNFNIDFTETLVSGIDYSACILDTATLYNQKVVYKQIPIQDFSTPSSK